MFCIQLKQLCFCCLMRFTTKRDCSLHDRVAQEFTFLLPHLFALYLLKINACRMFPVFSWLYFNARVEVQLLVKMPHLNQVNEIKTGTLNMNLVSKALLGSYFTFILTQLLSNLIQHVPYICVLCFFHKHLTV